MSLTASTMLALGTQAPEFSLPEVTSGEKVSLENFAGKDGLLVMFICRHLPALLTFSYLMKTES